MARSRVVLDVETIGIEWSILSKQEQEYYIAHAKGRDDAERLVEAQARMALAPLTCNVVAIGLLNPDSGRGEIHIVAPTYAHGALAPALACDPCDVITHFNEAQLLDAFWKRLQAYHQIITFNGRGFDGPVLMIRSMVQRIPVGRNLMPYRYSPEHHHLDLLDQLTFYGATRSPSLDIWCRGLGINSPKEQGSGKDVERLWRAGEYEQIVRYLAGDLVATAAFLERVEVSNIIPGIRNSKP